MAKVGWMLRTPIGLLVMLVAASGLGGCVIDDFAHDLGAALVHAPQAGIDAANREGRRPAPDNMASAQSIPWQLTPASAASRGQGEVTYVVDKPGLGRIRGTQLALQQLDQKIIPYTKPTPIVEACKETFDPQAKAAGAYAIEAHAAGPVQHGFGGVKQQVFFRIFYADPQDQGVEVRQAKIACTLGRSGRLLKATPV